MDRSRIILQNITVTPDTDKSIEVVNNSLQLVNDEQSPGVNKVYGTDGDGVKGWSDNISVITVASTDTLTPTPEFDAFEITAQAVNLTIANPLTDYANFHGFIIRLEDNGVARTLTFGNKYRNQGGFPTTTTAGKTMIITCLFDSTNNKYDTHFSEEL